MKSLNIYLLFFLLLGFVACDSELEIEPEQELSTNNAFADESTATASLMGIYSRAQDLEVFGAMPQIIADYQSDNVNFIGSFPTLQDINNFITLADNGSIGNIWRDNFRTILAANAVIKFVPSVEDAAFSSEERAQLVAEAKFMRAVTNFNLVNIFAQPFTFDNGASAGIPLVTEPSVLEGEVDFPARSSVAEVYNQIEQDLLDALKDLPESYGSPAFDRGRATKGAANGFLSRLYLYKGDWANALAKADEVINSDMYALASNYSFYNNNSSEDVFTIQNSATDNGATGSGGWGSYYQPAELGGRGDGTFSQDLLDAFAAEAGDKRFTELSLVGNNGATYPNKFSDAITNSDNAPVMRVTEMYLIKAEAMVKQSNAIESGAIDIINMLRDRAGLTAMAAGDFADANALVDQILLERRKELCFEGHRRMDLLRNNQPLRTSGSGVGISMPGDSKVILPIPQREIDLNASLDQNPGY